MSYLPTLPHHLFSFSVFSFHSLFLHFSSTYCLSLRGIIFEIPSPERLERFEAKAKQKVARNRPKNGPEDDPKDVITALNTERTVAENNRRDKETAVNVQCEKYPQLRDGEYVDDELYHSLLCSVFVDMLKELVREIRASQIYVDPMGIITVRETAKTALRKVDKTV